MKMTFYLLLLVTILFPLSSLADSLVCQNKNTGAKVSFDISALQLFHTEELRKACLNSPPVSSFKFVETKIYIEPETAKGDEDITLFKSSEFGFYGNILILRCEGKENSGTQVNEFEYIPESSKTLKAERDEFLNNCWEKAGLELFPEITEKEE